MCAPRLDSVIADIKSGKVTLRRRRPPNPLNHSADEEATGTSGSIRDSEQEYNRMIARNPGLKEMYDIMARMKRANRKSKIIYESELVGRGVGGAGGGSTVLQQDTTDGGEFIARTTRTHTRMVMDVVDL
uniref:Uncharacterized protein n=1 Tax=Anopheles maculatus TaxID=74869 RepID=A0A182SKQ8_9DIPT